MYLTNKHEFYIDFRHLNKGFTICNLIKTKLFVSYKYSNNLVLCPKNEASF